MICLDGSVPQKYGLRLNMDEKYKVLKKELSVLTDIPAEQILLVEIMGPVVKVTSPSIAIHLCFQRFDMYVYQTLVSSYLFQMVYHDM